MKGFRNVALHRFLLSQAYPGAPHIWIGGASAASRSESTLARFSPACFQPVKNRAIRIAILLRDDARGEHPRAIRLLLESGPLSSGLHELEDFHRRVVVVEDLGLRSLADELQEDGQKISTFCAAMSHWVEAGSGTPRLP